MRLGQAGVGVGAGIEKVETRAANQFCQARLFAYARKSRDTYFSKAVRKQRDQGSDEQNVRQSHKNELR